MEEKFKPCQRYFLGRKLSKLFMISLRLDPWDIISRMINRLDNFIAFEKNKTLSSFLKVDSLVLELRVTAFENFLRIEDSLKKCIGFEFFWTKFQVNLLTELEYILQVCEQTMHFQIESQFYIVESNIQRLQNLIFVKSKEMELWIWYSIWQKCLHMLKSCSLVADSNFLKYLLFKYHIHNFVKCAQFKLFFYFDFTVYFNNNHLLLSHSCYTHFKIGSHLIFRLHTFWLQDKVIILTLPIS